MKTAVWQQVEELFETAIGLPPEDRSAFLQKAASDATVRREVRSLLGSLDKAPETFLRPPSSGQSEESRTDPHGLIGKSVGRFEITAVIASGGMGTVYKALQKDPKRTVAVKVLAAWSWSQSARRRFSFESQILARLSHPHIAQIFESGTHDEMPYFVMEYIADALPITHYVEGSRLTIKQRLELMIQVCDAVQHGHQKGVIHRDLKPGNILVDGEGHVKVIDFGVAKSTDSDVAVTTMRTDVGQLIGTFQYMSPEQCLADPLGLDVRSDVYSLGIVLYELLCEKKPYDVSKTTIANAARVICDEQPVRPSVHHRSLRGDLELIVLKTLEKERERRYQSASDLGRDLRRFLSREPIEAKAPTAWFRAMGWFRRHPIAATSLLAGFVALGIVGGSMAGIEYTWRTPSHVEDDKGMKEVRLIALNGAIIHTWRPDPPATAIRGVDLDAVLQDHPTKVAIILRRWEDGGKHAGEICAYDLRKRRYDSPLWCDRVNENDLPPDPARALAATEFYPQKAWTLDIYPEIAGKEILVEFAHAFSRRAIRIYSAAGERLHQTWHDGSLHAVRFLPLAKLLVVAAVHDAHPWRDRGHPEISGEPSFGKPLVVFAFQPTLGDWNRSYLCTDDETSCVQPAWYRCLLPAEAATSVQSLRLPLPPATWNDDRHVAVNLLFTPTKDVPANAGWTIDQHGDRVGNAYHKTDSYSLQQENLPAIESFYLGPLPPIDQDP